MRRFHICLFVIPLETEGPSYTGFGYVRWKRRRCLLCKSVRVRTQFNHFGYWTKGEVDVREPTKLPVAELRRG